MCITELSLWNLLSINPQGCSGVACSGVLPHPQTPLARYRGRAAIFPIKDPMFHGFQLTLRAGA
jgi:hypothetical protein